MEKWLQDVLPILSVEHDAILSKRGDITVVFKVELPEIFSQSAEDFEALHQSLIKAIKVLPKNSVLHKQDIFVKARHQGRSDEAGSFLNRSSERYFEGRPYLGHSCYIMLTRLPDDQRQATSLFSSLIRRSIVPEQAVSPFLMDDFMDSVGQFERILSASSYVKLTRLTNADLTSDKHRASLIEQYCFLSHGEEGLFIREISFDGGLQIGNKNCQLYTLADVTELPSYCGSRIDYDKYSTDRTKFSIGFATCLGLLLPCDHIYNQYIFISDGLKVQQKLEKKRLKLQSLAAYSRENAIAHAAVNDFLNEAISEQRTYVQAHFNLLTWSESEDEGKQIKNMVAAAFAQMEAVAKQEKAGEAQIYWAGIPGNAGDFPRNDSFLTFVEQATCFFNLETNYRSEQPGKGIRFCDRLSGKPVFLDLFDRPRKEGITSNMGMLVAGTSGGGKSMTVNHILRSLYDQGAHCVVIDIGGSYKGLCELVGGYYFEYREEKPICFNPFYLSKGDVLDTEKKESLKALLVTLWKQENENFNRAEYVALSNALSGYYEWLAADEKIFACFNSFYEYLQTTYVKVLKGQNVKDRDFDVNNFLYVLRPYYKDGEFSYLLNATDNLDLLDQPFIVIELDNIKDHPILFPVVALLIMEMFISKMRKLAGTRKVLIIDEAWKAITKSGMAQFLQYAFKTIRKFNGIPGVITQELDDLVSSPIVKDAIVANADIKILMDMRKFINKFSKLQDVLGLSEKAKTILLSVNKDSREIFIDLGGQVSKVYKNELCKQEYYAYTTEGKERVKVMEYAAKYGSVEKGIEALVSE